MSLAVAETSSRSASLGLPFDDEAYKLCSTLCIGSDVIAVREYENLVWDRLESELVEGRFTGSVCIVYEAGYRAGMILLDGVAFGACIESPEGSIHLGEDALTLMGLLGGPATVRLCPRGRG